MISFIYNGCISSRKYCLDKTFFGGSMKNGSKSAE